MTQAFDQILKEAYQSVEDSLALEDRGWINFTKGSEIVSSSDRITTVAKARTYGLKDPLASRSIRLMTDYSFGIGMSWNTEDKQTKKALSTFWDAPENQSLLSIIGQRKSSDKLLVDGEIFFAVFLGSQGQATIRRIDPLEIMEIITNPDDIDDVRYYKRDWVNRQNVPKVNYYRSFSNIKDVETPDALGAKIKASEEALVYHLAINDFTGQRGNSYLYPALQWLDLYRKFLGSRVAIMLALAKFAWHTKVKGGQTAVDTIKGKTNEVDVPAGSHLVENLGSDTQPIKTDTGATNAYQDGRQLKLQICAASGWPEQYYGDISIGNLATAKTVELPVLKMCQSYQNLWRSAYETIDNLVLEHAGIAEDKRYVDRDFPDITPEDAIALAQSLQMITTAFPEIVTSREVLQRALFALGISNSNDVINQIQKESGMPEVRLARVLREFREVIVSGNGHKV